MRKVPPTLALVGAIFTAIGSIFLIIALIVFFNFEAVQNNPNVHGDLWALIGVFGFIGILFPTMGINFLAISGKARRQKRHVREAGYYVYANVVDICENRSVNYMGRHPLTLVCEARDEYLGTVDRFVSDSFLGEPRYQIGDSVRVFVDPDDNRIYSVDV